MRRIFILFYFLSVVNLSAGQIPNGYYDSANGKTGYELKTALKDIITNGHTDQGYDNLYTLYENSDTDSYYENDNTVLDMYSENPSGADSYEYAHNTDKCGDYQGEGDCYNREHIMPQSVFSSASPMKSDGHFVVPADGYVNNRRSNYAFGIVNNPDWTSSNGSKLGANSTTGYSDTVFEPIDEFKGDIARMLFYFATRYEDQVANWSHDMLNGTSDQVFADWFLDILLQWNQDDPVSQRETDRNDAVYNYQGNRNPFIDHPEWVNDIWNQQNGNALASTTIAIMDFDGTTPEWSFTNDVAFFDNNSDGFYGIHDANGDPNDGSPTDTGDGNPSDVSQIDYANISGDFLFVNDLDDEGDNGTSGEAKITFSSIDISSYTNVSLSFDYDIVSFDSADYFRYQVFYDGTGQGQIDLPKNNQGTVSVSIPDSVNNLYIELYIKQNGGSDQAGIDNIKIVSNTSSNDTDTEVYDTSNQPAAGSISSTIDTSGEAIEVFNMEIQDQGSGDGLPTKITRIRLQPNNTNTADWTDNIQGFVIFDDNANTINPASVDITDAYIDFNFNSGDLDIADNSSVILHFYLYLNTSNIEDGKVLSFMVDADNHGFTADSSGSDFASTFTLGDFNSNDFTIDVTLSEIRFIQQPTDVETGQAVSQAVQVATTDENGNIDIDFTDRIGFTTTGSFDASATTVVNAINGIATFDNLVFDTAATGITLTTTDPDNLGWTNITSVAFDVTEPSTNCASESFENAGDVGQYNTINWTGDNNIDWKATDARSDEDLDGNAAIMLRNGSLTNQSSFSNGCGTIEFDYARIYSGNSVLKIFVNGTQYGGDIDVTDTNSTHFSVDVNVSGNIDVELRNSSNRTLISNLQWSCYGTCTAPTVDATFDSDSPQDISSISATLSWNSGSGSNRIVVIREGQDISFVPQDDTTYTANSTFGQGTDVSGNGEYIIYNNNGTSVNVSGLSAGKLYYVKIFEYNCDSGSEKYYTNGTPASDFFVTTPNNPASFDTGCITTNTIELNWTAPQSSGYDGYLLVVREGSSSPHTVTGTAPSDINGANTDYSNASEFGGTTPYSRYLYVGNNTNITISGLTEGSEYTFKLFSYREVNGVYEYSDGTQTTQTISMNDVTNAHATPQNQSAIVYWFNPSSCFDEILVVANETAGIDFSPSGDGSSYNANNNYSGNNSIVYKGVDNNVVVSGLTNGTTYYFEIFVRNGTEWSNGVEISVTPQQGTEFQAGQLIFVGYDGQVNGSGADDEYLIATLVDIVPGTTFSLVNSRYEAGAPANVRTDKWGGAGNDPKLNPGVAEITYNGTSDIPAGSVLRMQTDFSNDFITYLGVITGTTETDRTSEFSATLAFGDLYKPNISSSNPDQIFLAQGAFIFDGTEDENQANYTLNGHLLHGITNGVDWVDLSEACSGDDAGGNARESRLHPSLNCFNVENNDPNAISGYYQNDELHNGSYRDIILAISDQTHWTLGTGRYTVDPASTDEDRAGHSFTVSGGHNPGTWVSTSDTNWFNCSNWETLTVPDATTNVSIDSNSSVDAVIDNTAMYADLFNGIATCNNLTISNLNLKIEGNQTLEIHGNLDIQNGGTIDADDDDNNTPDGNIYLYGNWTNSSEANFIEGNSSVYLVGSNTQSVNCNAGGDTEKFYNLEIDNPQGVTFASGNIHAEGNLTVTNSPDITITDGHYMLAGINLINNANIIIENQGSLVQTDDNGTIGGTGTFKLNKTSLPLNNYYDYVYWSSPINSNTFTLGEIVPNAWRYYDFDPTYQPGATYPFWHQLSASDVPNVGQGYAISAPTNTGTNNPITLSVSFIKGNDPFNNGPINYNLILGIDNDGAGDDDYNLVGNPYPSAIDFDKLSQDNSNINGSYSAWTNCAGLNNQGHHVNSGYTTYTVGGSTSTQACQDSITTYNYVAGRYIASGQGFMVEASNSGNLVFNNTQRILNNNDNFINRPTNNIYDRIWLDFTDSNNNYNQIAIGFYNEATDGHDRLFDAYVPDTDATGIYTLIDNTKYVIQGMSSLNGNEKIIPLGIKLENTSTINIHINRTEGVLNTMDIYLHDLNDNSYHNLKTSDYTTNLQAGEYNNRYELVFTTDLANVDKLANDNEIVLLQNEGIFTLQSQNDTKIKAVQVYDLTGKLLFNNLQVDDIQQMIDLKQIAAGNLLLFKIEMENNKFAVKKAIKK